MVEHRPLQIDVGRLVQRTVASLYASLVTRPTGRAVRLAIEAQLAEVPGTAIGLIDLSEVTVLDFSCADEVVAKLLLRYGDEDRPGEAFFVFRGALELHRDPIEAVLERHRLAAVVQDADGTFELLGTSSDGEARAWTALETRGRASPGDLEDRETVDPTALDRLVARRLAFRAGTEGDVVALSRFVEDLR